MAQKTKNGGLNVSPEVMAEITESIKNKKVHGNKFFTTTPPSTVRQETEKEFINRKIDAVASSDKPKDIRTAELKEMKVEVMSLKQDSENLYQESLNDVTTNNASAFRQEYDEQNKRMIEANRGAYSFMDSLIGDDYSESNGRGAK